MVVMLPAQEGEPEGVHCEINVLLASRLSRKHKVVFHLIVVHLVFIELLSSLSVIKITVLVLLVF